MPSDVKFAMAVRMFGRAAVARSTLLIVLINGTRLPRHNGLSVRPRN